MPQENPEQLDINELYKTCIAKFSQYEKKISNIDFSKSDTNLEQEKCRISAFKQLFNGYVNDINFKEFVPDYQILLSSLFKNTNRILDLYLKLNGENSQQYNFTLNVVAYAVTSFKYKIYVKYLEYLQVEYPQQFNEIIFFMQNQALSVKSSKERQKLEQKIKELKEIIHTFSKKVHSMKNAENIEKLKKKMDSIFTEIQRKKRAKFDNEFPDSIGDLREALSSTLNALHDYTSEIINNFSNTSMKFEF